MALCDSIVGIPKGCGDNNLGAIKRAFVGSFEDVTVLTVTDTSDPDTDGEVTAATRAEGTKFEEFNFPKDTSMFSQEDVVDLVADTNSYAQTVELGFRRIDLRKRNALMLLATGRRDLIVVAEDFNGDYWMLGSDQGLRLSAGSTTTNNTRSAGQAMNVTLTSENEKHMMYKVTTAAAEALLVAAI
jgi:hypothetical protein